MKSGSQWSLVRQRFARHRVAVAALFVLIVLYAMAAFAEVVSPYPSHWRELSHAYCPPQPPRFSFSHGLYVHALKQSIDPITFRKTYIQDENDIVPLGFFVKGEPYRLWGLIPWDRHLVGVSRGALAPEPKTFYLFGADRYGQDIFSRIVYASRISLSIGIVSIIVTFLLGVTIGGISGYVGGAIDNLIQRFIEILNAFPRLPFWLAMGAIVPADWSPLRVYFFITLGLSLLGWTDLARVVRGKMLSLREEDYAVAARLLGAGHGRIIFRHLLPGFTSHIIVVLTLQVPVMILGETSLSFLGLGLRPPVVSWGVMLQDCMNMQVVANYPWLLLPVVFIVLAVLSCNFVGDGLRDAADPYGRRGGEGGRARSRTLPSPARGRETAATEISHSCLLEVKDLQTQFMADGRELKAVDGASLTVRRGQILAVVGESGCGKTVMAYSVLRLIQNPGRIAGGQIILHHRDAEQIDITALADNSDQLFDIRGRLVGMIFQEPSSALSPVHTIGNQICEAILLHKNITRKEAERQAADLLGRVGIPSPAMRLRQYPHEMSGGMRQRAVIAMALACGPELLIADEPTTALDVTIQAQVLALIKSLRSQTGTSVLLITHDLGVVAQTADEVAVMYLGRIVERGPVRSVLRNPRHPYTRGLLESLPSRAAKGTRLASIAGSVPSLMDVPAGCPFHPRCQFAQAGRCDIGTAPLPQPLGEDRMVACLRAEEI